MNPMTPPINLHTNGETGLFSHSLVKTTQSELPAETLLDLFLLEKKNLYFQYDFLTGQ